MGSAACQTKRKKRGKTEVESPILDPLVPPLSTRRDSAISTVTSEVKRVAEKRKLPHTKDADAETSDKEVPKRALKKRSGRKSHSDLGLKTVRTPDPEFEMEEDSL